MHGETVKLCVTFSKLNKIGSVSGWKPQYKWMNSLERNGMYQGGHCSDRNISAISETNGVKCGAVTDLW